MKDDTFCCSIHMFNLYLLLSNCVAFIVPELLFTVSLITLTSNMPLSLLGMWQDVLVSPIYVFLANETIFVINWAYTVMIDSINTVRYDFEMLIFFCFFFINVYFAFSSTAFLLQCSLTLWPTLHRSSTCH